MRPGLNQTSTFKQLNNFQSALHIKYFPTGNFQCSNFYFIMLAFTFCLSVNCYMYIFALTLDSKMFKFLFTGYPTETKIWGKYFQSTCIHWLFSDGEECQGISCIPYSVIINSMISSPASSEVRFFGFEIKWLHRLISKITYISKSLFYVSKEV